MIEMLVDGTRDFARAFKEVNQIVHPNGIGVQHPVAISASPRDGLIRIQIDPSLLTQQQQRDLFLWKLTWSGSNA